MTKYTNEQQRVAHAKLKAEYLAALRAACAIDNPAERRQACDAAHVRYETECEAIGVDETGDE